MVVMKGYVRNPAHPEGSMIEDYTTNTIGNAGSFNCLNQQI
jgi:hypothetical protein